MKLMLQPTVMPVAPPMLSEVYFDIREHGDLPNFGMFMHRLFSQPLPLHLDCNMFLMPQQRSHEYTDEWSPSTAAGTSASSNTMKGAFPPASIDILDMTIYSVDRTDIRGSLCVILVVRSRLSSVMGVRRYSIRGSDCELSSREAKAPRYAVYRT
jgi:hypothetical protein